MAAKRIFLSYSWKDKDVALMVRDRLQRLDFEVWMDIDAIQPGDRFSERIEEGLKAADYYVVLISESSIKSDWVKREISTAIRLADNKKLTPIPVLLDTAPVPIEFSGLLYIDARSSVEAGVQRLLEYFKAQDTIFANLEKRMVVLKSDDDPARARRKCQDDLRTLTPGDLRFHMAERFSLAEIKTLWFDLFSRKMDDEVQVINLTLAIIELLDRSRREDLIVNMLDLICRNFPRFSLIVFK
ncbi:MAG: hypothetical protein QOJ86_4156 [Bradyrhizobium sp.]|jgi:hypothetical protein|nr:hypothetical protein [Bradyrhizobium sp.]